MRQQESTVVDAVRTIPSALRILVDDRRRLTTMLVAVGHLGDVAGQVLDASRADLVANLRNLQPTLQRLSEVGDVIPQTLGVLLTYPTADTVEQEYFGDYGNLSLTLDVSAKSLLQTFGGPSPVSGGASSQGPGKPGTSLPLPPPVTRWAPTGGIGRLLPGPLS